MAKIIMNVSSDNVVAVPVQNQWMVLDAAGRYDHVATPGEAQDLANAGSNRLVPRRWYIESVEQPGVFLNQYEDDPEYGHVSYAWGGPLAEYDENLGELNPGFTTLYRDLETALATLGRLSLNPVPVRLVSADEINNKYLFKDEDDYIVKHLSAYFFHAR